MLNRHNHSLIGAALCFFGWHRWRDSKTMPERVCTRCGWREGGL